MNKDTLRQIVNVLTVLVTLTVNGLANALPFNGQTTGAISDRFKVYFVPAGYVFSIWGLIYIGLLAFAIYQALPSQRNNPRLRRIGYWFALSCLANSAWIFLWHFGFFVWTLVVMVTLLISLIVIYLRLDINRARISRIERWCIDIPFSIYLGWITVATVANMTDVLSYVKWSGWGINPETWAVVILVVATGIATMVSLTRGDIAYMLVLIWAFIGIAVKQAGTPVVTTTVWIMVTAMVVITAVGALQHRQSNNNLAHA
jgi:hypothetical protein